MKQFSFELSASASQNVILESLAILTTLVAFLSQLHSANVHYLNGVYISNLENTIAIDGEQNE